MATQGFFQLFDISLFHVLKKKKFKLLLVRQRIYFTLQNYQSGRFNKQKRKQSVSLFLFNKIHVNTVENRKDNMHINKTS